MGHLLTGSNFDDSVGKVTGGRNGYGAKLANIFSSSFTVETCDTRHKLHYRQSWRDNMTQSEAPSIRSTSSVDEESDFTRVTFVPDLKRFGAGAMRSLRDTDLIKLMKVN